MKFIRIITTLIFTFAVLAGYAQSGLKSGLWRGALKTAGGKDIPFNFEVGDLSGKTQLTIMNGAERFAVTNVHAKGDSVFVKMPLFDSEFKLKLTDDALNGNWIKHLADSDVVMPFTATYNTPWRFKSQPPLANVSGRWAATFGEGDTKDELVGEFVQNGSKLTGTFLSTTGDYRFLEGVVSGNMFYLSCFDGGHAYLFTGAVNGQKISNGKFYSGKTSVDNWTAVKNPNAKLPDAYSLTALKPGYKKIAFTFKDINGKAVSLSDARFKNKVVIVQILGSWCPNCMDETAYLVNYYKKFHAKGVEVVGLAYERSTEFAKARKTLLQLKNRFTIPYPLLITGYTPAKPEAAKSLPMLAKVVGFPTTIIIDKKGDVRKIHTGFSGPGTGEHYTEFVSEFETLTNSLLAEK